MSKRSLYNTLLAFGAIMIVWNLVSLLHLADPIFIPSFRNVVISFIHLFNKNFFLEQLLPSLKRVMTAFSVAVLIAVPMGILIGRYGRIGDFIEPVFSFVRYLPVASMVPLTILWFGIEDVQKISVITIGIVFQLTLLVAFIVRGVPKELMEAGSIMQLSRFRQVFQIVIPYSLPAIWDSMRISAGWAWSYLVLAELVAGNSGVGYFIVQSQRYLQIENVFAGIIYIGLLGLLTDIFFRVFERWLFAWK